MLLLQSNVASSAGGALYLRGPGGSSLLAGCVFCNNTETHVRTIANVSFAFVLLILLSCARVMDHLLANDSLPSSNDTIGWRCHYVSDGYHVMINITIWNIIEPPLCGGAIWVATSDRFRAHLDLLKIARLERI
jgi:hypothetical protein